ncbi:hypothetical protein B0H14DRAFT_3758349 [Mycena olivaceomarginata]|nr:hypothetical protein B0H14DRAFT_3758349 [Mycena olivaceomarginata]
MLKKQYAILCGCDGQIELQHYLLAASSCECKTFAQKKEKGFEYTPDHASRGNLTFLSSPIMITYEWEVTFLVHRGSKYGFVHEVYCKGRLARIQDQIIQTSMLHPGSLLGPRVLDWHHQVRGVVLQYCERGNQKDEGGFPASRPRSSGWHSSLQFLDEKIQFNFGTDPAPKAPTTDATMQFLSQTGPTRAKADVLNISQGQSKTGQKTCMASGGNQTSSPRKSRFSNFPLQLYEATSIIYRGLPPFHSYEAKQIIQKLSLWMESSPHLLTVRGDFHSQQRLHIPLLNWRYRVILDKKGSSHDEAHRDFLRDFGPFRDDIEFDEFRATGPGSFNVCLQKSSLDVAVKEKKIYLQERRSQRHRNKRRGDRKKYRKLHCVKG